MIEQACSRKYELSLHQAVQKALKNALSVVFCYRIRRNRRTVKNTFYKFIETKTMEIEKGAIKKAFNANID